jgi:hypothetical protein
VIYVVVASQKRKYEGRSRSKHCALASRVAETCSSGDCHRSNSLRLLGRGPAPGVPDIEVAFVL